MGRQRETPAPVVGLRRRLEAWRKRRGGRGRIPDDLWKAAAELAVVHGVSRTSSVLKLSYYSLKKRVAEQEQRLEQTAEPTFVEVNPQTIPWASQCVIECHNAAGARMRVQWTGCDAADVVAWGRIFFGDDS